MKKEFLLLSLFLLLFFSFSQATTINIDVSDFAFNPAVVVAEVGDTLIWTESSGTHTTTSTSVPSGATTWDYTFTGTGDTFIYNITVPGDYAYQCSNHPSLMTGTIRVADILPLEENFDYATSQTLTDVSPWQNHSGTGTFILVNNGGLSYSGYPSSGIGNSVTINGGSGSREDVNRIFTEQSASVYASFLVSVQNASTSADYFLHLAATFPTNTFRGRVFVQNDGLGNLKFGVSKGSSTITLAAGDYSFNTTYLLVLKYEVVGDLTGTDDVAKLFVNPVLTDPEPTADATSTDNTISDSPIGGIALRQGSNSLSVQIDGIRIGSSWSDVVPVELTSFTATTMDNSVLLNWITATELNNTGFKIERKQENRDWNKIAFIDGHGTTASPHTYSYYDGNLSPGKYSYRLKQIDYDGSYEYSKVVEANIGLPSKFELSQNYPNPFNPSTIITYSLPEASQVTLKVYNSLGQEVSTLVNSVVEAGKHNVEFDASGFSSGIYYYMLITNGLTLMKKMMLLK